MNLFKELEYINELIPTDFGGGSPISKTYLMAYLILRNNLKIYAEIGVYRGKSLFTTTYAIKQNNGISYGIDPYTQDAAREYDIEEYLQKQIDKFIDELNFENIYQDVVNLKSELDFENHLELIRKKSSESCEFFHKNNIKIDMLHIDGNHDTKYVLEDVELYLPLLKQNSFIVMDDIDWDSVKPAYDKLKESATVIFESDTFSILINSKVKENIVNEYKFELSSIYNIIESSIEKNEVINDKSRKIEQKDAQLENSNQLIKEKEIVLNQITEQLNQTTNKLKQKETQLENSNNLLEQRNTQIKNFNHILEQRDIQLKNSNQIIKQKEYVINQIKEQRNQTINISKQKDAQLENSNQIIEQKDAQLENSNQIIEQKDAQLENSNQLIKEKEIVLNQITEQLNQTTNKLKQKETQLENSNQLIKEKEIVLNQITEQLNQTTNKLKQKETQLENSNNLLEQRNTQIKNSNQIINEKETLINKIRIQENHINELKLEMNKFIEHYNQMKHLDNRSIFQRFFSWFPGFYILFKGNGGLKHSLVNIKGYNAVKKNGLFDEGYYLKDNKDIRFSGVDPLLHYIYHGFKEGRKPGPGFDADYYLKTYADVRNSNLNPLIHYALYGIKENRKPTKTKKISVIVTSYNHEKYIRECVDSILMQKGNFELELILGDDNSQDDTRKILEEYQKKYPKIINLFPKTENMGVTKNLKRCFEAVEGDYISICEGDDYWTDSHKLQKQLSFLEERSDCAMCFNSILMSFEDKNEKNYIFQQNLDKDTFTTRELILDNFIGNFSCCMYRTDIIKRIPDAIYEFFTVDWMINIVCSEYGNIGFLNEQMTVYRIHDSGLWSGKNISKKLLELSELADTYNEFLSFKYDSEFKKFKENIPKIEKNINPKLSVSLITYNQKKYITQAIESALMQKTDFDFEIVLSDDCSTDGTRDICIQYKERYPEKIRLILREENVGAVKNYLSTYQACDGKYVAYLEGDDYWTDPLKLQKQVDFLDANPDYVICCHHVEQINEKDEKLGRLLSDYPDTLSVNDLCKMDFISTASCVVRNKLLDEIPNWIYNFPGCDWTFDILNAEKGKIKFLPETMATYRIHPEGLWSFYDEISQLELTISMVEHINKYLDFKYDAEFRTFLIKLYAKLIKFLKKESPNKDINEYEKALKLLKNHDSTIPYYKSSPISPKAINKPLQDLIILDDVFPHPLSAFRLQEYTSYLEHFKKIEIYSSGLTFSLLNESRSIESVIEEFEKEYPQFKGQIKKFEDDRILNAKLIYAIFLGNAHFFIDKIEKYKIPFVFTLYPGGTFHLNNIESDQRLKMVFNSPYFKKVIVTQKVTYDYLIDNNFCKPEQIEEIFGVVTPLELINKEYNHEKYFKIDKPDLDICFVAHKYSEKGIDKGYDIFIEVAHKLAEKYDNIYFHVVGGFDEDVLDITQIKDRITFYGPKLSEWFDEFYKDKDIILSPNIPFKLADGAFDGFPTGCCTDAGLHKVAVFCTDELNLNTKYKDKEEIVIIPHNTQKIIEIIEEYYNKPEKLQEIAESGYLKIKELYNYENQVAPRIKVLEKLIKEYEND